MKKEKDYEKLCVFCEHAHPLAETDDDADRMVYCYKKKKNMPKDSKCLFFFYDLLKREPLAVRLPEGLDPAMLSLEEDSPEEDNPQEDDIADGKTN